MTLRLEFSGSVLRFLYALYDQGRSKALCRVNPSALPAFLLQFPFQCLFATASKPFLEPTVTAATGVTNMMMDALLQICLNDSSFFTALNHADPCLPDTQTSPLEGQHKGAFHDAGILLQRMMGA